jgi:hypothetical protein
MNRLFTFGCSLTNYHYPTWADIIAENFDEYQNWGEEGAGNSFILNSLIECDQRNQLTSSDTVIILWSSIARIDYYQLNKWGHLRNKYFDLKNRDVPYSCPDGYQLLSCSWVIAALNFLRSRDITWKMFHWQELDVDTPIYKLYKESLSPMVYAPFEKNSRDYKISPDAVREHFRRQRELNANNQVTDHHEAEQNINILDWHPSPLNHLNWVEKHLPEYIISEQAKYNLHTIDQCLFAQQSYKFKRSQPTRF